MNPLQFYKDCTEKESLGRAEAVVMTQFHQMISSSLLMRNENTNHLVSSDYKMKVTSFNFPMMILRDKHQCHNFWLQFRGFYLNILPHIPEKVRPRVVDMICFKKDKVS